MACVAVGCQNRMGGNNSDNKISFHRFPKDPELRENWVKSLSRPGWKPSPYSRLCSIHFNNSCYRPGYLLRVLHSDAVPTIFTEVITDSKVKYKRLQCLKPTNSATSKSPKSITGNIERQMLKETIRQQKITITNLSYKLKRCREISIQRRDMLKCYQQKYNSVCEKLKGESKITGHQNTKLERKEIDKVLNKTDTEEIEETQHTVDEEVKELQFVNDVKDNIQLQSFSNVREDFQMIAQKDIVLNHEPKEPNISVSIEYCLQLKKFVIK